jgi:hypothetical protein
VPKSRSVFFRALDLPPVVLTGAARHGSLHTFTNQRRTKRN